jgi:hypothetical protein
MILAAKTQAEFPEGKVSPSVKTGRSQRILLNFYHWIDRIWKLKEQTLSKIEQHIVRGVSVGSIFEEVLTEIRLIIIVIPN